MSYGPDGTPAETWETVTSRWASVEDKSGRELYRAQQINADISSIIILREQYSGLSETNRILLDGRTFNIASVLNASSRSPREGQSVACTEVRAG